MLRTEINNLSGAQRDYTPTHHICGLGLDLGLCKAGSSAWEEPWHVAKQPVCQEESHVADWDKVLL